MYLLYKIILKFVYLRCLTLRRCMCVPPLTRTSLSGGSRAIVVSLGTSETALTDLSFHQRQKTKIAFQAIGLIDSFIRSFQI